MHTHTCIRMHTHTYNYTYMSSYMYSGEASGGDLKGRLIYIVHARVHVTLAPAMEVVFDGKFIKILLDYLDIQRRSSSDEDVSDEDEV